MTITPSVIADASRLRAIIVDIDGTLLDLVDAHAKAWQDAFREFGHDIPLAALRREIGKGSDQLLPVFLSRQEIEARGKALEARRGELLKANFLPYFKPFPPRRLTCCGACRMMGSGSCSPPRRSPTSCKPTSASSASPSWSTRRCRRRTLRDPSRSRTSSTLPCSGSRAWTRALSWWSATHRTMPGQPPGRGSARSACSMAAWMRRRCRTAAVSPFTGTWPTCSPTTTPGTSAQS